MLKLLKRIGIGIANFFISSFYVWVAAILGGVVGWIFGDEFGVWVFFGIIVGVILFIFGRQIYWFVAGKVDYEGRNGLLKRLWKKIFKK